MCYAAIHNNSRTINNIKAKNIAEARYYVIELEMGEPFEQVT